MRPHFCKRPASPEYEGIGALYEAPDGSLYQVQGLAADEELRGIGEDAMTQMMGIGYLGEVRQGPDGNLYQYVQGVDGLGNPIGGFWSRFKRGLRSVHRVAQRGGTVYPRPLWGSDKSWSQDSDPNSAKGRCCGL